MANLEATGKEVVDAAVAVHRALGPGLLESAYEQCLAYELAERGLGVERQKELPLIYRGRRMENGYRVDLLVEGQVVVELKSVERLEPIHEAQLISYLKLSGLHLGFLINFNTRLLRDGLRRIVHNLTEPS
jgi:GxxExxY protein